MTPNHFQTLKPMDTIDIIAVVAMTSLVGGLVMDKSLRKASHMEIARQAYDLAEAMLKEKALREAGA